MAERGGPDGIKYFIPALPEHVTDDEMTAHFSKYGELVKAVVIKDKGTDMSRGFGYVTMADLSSRQAILADTHLLGGKAVSALLTKDSLQASSADVKKVHLGKLAPDVSAEAIREVFSMFGMVLDVHTPKDPNTGERRPFGFVTFGAEEAFNAAVAASPVSVGECQVVVRAADQSQQQASSGGWGGGPAMGCWGDGAGSKGCWGSSGWGPFCGKGDSRSGGKGGDTEGLPRYYVPGLPESVTDDELKVHFSRFGEVVDALVVKDKVTELSRGFGYVTMKDLSSREQLLGEKHDFSGKTVTVLLTKDALSGCDVKKVHLGRLPEETTAETIRDVFSRFGTVLDVHTPKDPNTGVRKNFGFVTFGTTLAFQAAVQAGEVQIGMGKVSVKAAAQSSDGPKGGGAGAWAKGGFDPWGWDCWGGQGCNFGGKWGSKGGGGGKGSLWAGWDGYGDQMGGKGWKGHDVAWGNTSFGRGGCGKGGCLKGWISAPY